MNDLSQRLANLADDATDGVRLTNPASPLAEVVPLGSAHRHQHRTRVLAVAAVALVAIAVGARVAAVPDGVHPVRTAGSGSVDRPEPIAPPGTTGGDPRPTSPPRPSPSSTTPEPPTTGVPRPTGPVTTAPQTVVPPSTRPPGPTPAGSIPDGTYVATVTGLVSDGAPYALSGRYGPYGSTTGLGQGTPFQAMLDDTVTTVRGLCLPHACHDLTLADFATLLDGAPGSVAGFDGQSRTEVSKALALQAFVIGVEHGEVHAIVASDAAAVDTTEQLAAAGITTMAPDGDVHGRILAVAPGTSIGAEAEVVIWAHDGALPGSVQRVPFGPPVSITQCDAQGGHCALVPSTEWLQGYRLAGGHAGGEVSILVHDGQVKGFEVHQGGQPDPGGE